MAEKLYSGNNSALARALDMKPQSFYQYTKGARTPGADILIRLSEINVNIHWLLTGKGEMLIENHNKNGQPKATEPEIPFEIKNLSGDAQHVYKQLMSIVDSVRHTDAPPEVKLKLYEGMSEAVEEFQRSMNDSSASHDPDSASDK